MEFKVGIGYDIHRFRTGRKLILGGVEIPYAMGLDGHSDADVLIHAICDAILGALGKGDIGEHFSNADERYRNISSIKLLEKVYEWVQEEDYVVNNVDAILQLEEPHLKEYKPKMRFHIAYALAMDESAINIKATTKEGLGAIGKKEGVAAFASVLLAKNKKGTS